MLFSAIFHPVLWIVWQLGCWGMPNALCCVVILYAGLSAWLENCFQVVEVVVVVWGMSFSSTTPLFCCCCACCWATLMSCTFWSVSQNREPNLCLPFATWAHFPTEVLIRMHFVMWNCVFLYCFLHWLNSPYLTNENLAPGGEPYLQSNLFTPGVLSVIS